ncbi:MAG: hypothetical protein IPK07_31380 [Deltaproteobacteria bacterium]|nr:hypothetical protein [Deltaproteobacteria bacterium]
MRRSVVVLVSWIVALAALGGCGGPDDGARELGPPIEVARAELETWVWEPVPDMHCADGSSAGVVVNLTERSRDVVVFFQGGGACWNALTCAVQPGNLRPMGDDPLATWMSDGEHAQSGIFDRDDPTNPLGDASYVVIPYCTGDLHLGDAVAGYGVHHVGYANVSAALARIVPTFRHAPRVVVAGFSAGGVGAAASFHQIATAFERVGRPELALIDDAGPVLRPPYLSALASRTIRDAWGLTGTIEPWCPECVSDGYHAAYATSLRLHPGTRASLVCAYADTTVRVLYAALLSPVENGRLEAGLEDFAAALTTAAPSHAPSEQRTFFYAGDRHGATETVPLAATPGLAGFLRAQLDGDAEWASVRP